MAKRTPSKQTQHDRRVSQIVRQLTKDGWSVQADLPGHDRPDPIGGGNYIPDIRAKKHGAERIIEVETPETLNRDKKQHEAFRRRAGQKPRTKFEIEEA